MFKNKYSNVLTMFLVILIVAILGIVIYFGYSVFNAKSINTNASSVIDEFEKATTSVKKRDTSNLSSSNTTENEGNVTDGTPQDPMALLNTSTSGNQTETETSQEEEKKVYMENYEVMGTIKIPKTGIEYPVLESVTKRSLEIAVGIAYGPGLNKVGNTIIYGHNYRNGLFFSNNKKLSNGDKIIITDKSGETVTYIIYNIYQTDPNDASYMQRDTKGTREISLQTCTDDSSGRIIIWAREQGATVEE